MKRIMARPIRRFARDRKGAMAVMGAIFLVFVAGSLAIGVDAASLFVEKRRSQGAVDLAAIAAARDLPHAHAAALATVTDNRIGAVEQLVLTTGNYMADPSVAPDERFRPNVPPLNAARVEMRNRAPVYFARAFLNADSVEIATRATAVASAAAAFSVGSRLLSLNGGVLNAVLGRLLGGNVSLTAMDYNALAGFNIDLFRFSDALSTRIGGEIGTYEELAKANATMRHVIDALIDIAHNSGNGTTQIALQNLGNSTNPGTIALPAGQIVDFGQHGGAAIGQGGSAFALRASALSILSTAAQIANGARQVEVVTGLSLPPLVNLQLGILIGERPQNSPWIAVGEKDVTVYTAQTRVRLLADVNVLGVGVVNLPVHVNVAAAEASLHSVTCGANPSQDARVTLNVRPAVVGAWIGTPVNNWQSFSSPPKVGPTALVTISLPLLPPVSVTGSAHAAITNLKDQQLTFDGSDIAQLRAKTAKTTDFTSSLVASLVKNLKPSVQVGGGGGLLKLPIPNPTAAILGGLLSAAPILDGVLNDLLAVLGIGLGEADTWVHGVRCDGAVLVN